MLGKGYDPGMVRDVVRRLQRRRPDIESLAYFDAGLADRHSKRAETPAAPAMAGAGVDWDAAIGVYARSHFLVSLRRPRAPRAAGKARHRRRHGCRDTKTGMSR